MLLGFQKKFKDGTPTLFKEKILSGEKIHTLRESRRYCKSDSLQLAYGVRTKHYEQFNKGIPSLEKRKGVQSVFITYESCLEVTVSGRYLMPHEIELLIKNDGLTKQQFIDWFLPNGKDEWSGYIHHWTDFKY